VIDCHCAGGGKPVAEPGSGIDVADSEPTDLRPVFQSRLLDRVDLPQFVSGRRLWSGFDSALRSPRPVDALFLKCALENARGGYVRGIEVIEQFDSDSFRSPTGMRLSKANGETDDGVGIA
jgi:hypothetical protein